MDETGRTDWENSVCKSAHIINCTFHSTTKRVPYKQVEQMGETLYEEVCETRHLHFSAFLSEIRKLTAPMGDELWLLVSCLYEVNIFVIRFLEKVSMSGERTEEAHVQSISPYCEENGSIAIYHRHFEMRGNVQLNREFAEGGHFEAVVVPAANGFAHIWSDCHSEVISCLRKAEEITDIRQNIVKNARKMEKSYNLRHNPSKKPNIHQYEVGKVVLIQVELNIRRKCKLKALNFPALIVAVNTERSHCRVMTEQGVLKSSVTFYDMKIVEPSSYPHVAKLDKASWKYQKEISLQVAYKAAIERRQTPLNNTEEHSVRILSVASSDYESTSMDIDTASEGDTNAGMKVDGNTSNRCDEQWGDNDEISPDITDLTDSPISHPDKEKTVFSNDNSSVINELKTLDCTEEDTTLNRLKRMRSDQIPENINVITTVPPISTIDHQYATRKRPRQSSVTSTDRLYTRYADRRENLVPVKIVKANSQTAKTRYYEVAWGNQSNPELAISYSRVTESWFNRHKEWKQMLEIYKKGNCEDKSS